MTVLGGVRRCLLAGGLAVLLTAGPLAAGPSDLDNDTVPDGQDNCPVNVNPDQLDTDEDARGDVCDNCPIDANGDQANLDADSEGDACDLDDDGDTLVDLFDNCPTVANPTQVDTDADNTGDACEPRPDARLRRGSRPLTADDVYNTTGAGQARSATVLEHGSATFTVQVRNDAAVADTVRVRGAGSTGRFTVTYRSGGANVTAQVIAGTFELDELAPGATDTVSVTIRAKAGIPHGATISRVVRVTSQVDTTTKDAVKATVTRH